MARRRQLDFSTVAQPVQIGATARAVLHKTVDDGVTDLEMAKEIRIDLIEPDPEQPRKHIDPEALRELAQSVRVQGILQPIVVEWVPERERFRIISGERRWRAARLATELEDEEGTEGPRRALSSIPAVVRNPGTVDRYVQQVYENEQRQDYSDVERAFAYERLKQLLSLTWEDLATKLGLSRGRVHQILRTKNRLAPAVQQEITAGRLTGRHGLYLAPLPEVTQEAVAAAVTEHQLTHEQTREIVKRIRQQIKVPMARQAVPATLSPADERTDTPDAVAFADAAANSTERDGAVADAVPSMPPMVERAAVAHAVAEVLGDQVDGPRRRRRDEVGRATRLVRQLVAFDILVPDEPVARAKLSHALDDLQSWIDALRAQLGSDSV